MNIDFIFHNRWFMDQFFHNCDLLLQVWAKFKTIKDKNSLDYRVYFENILISCRALFLESDKLEKNYTVRNFLKLINAQETIKEIDDFLDSTMIQYNEQDISVKNGIKKITDKLLAHYDSSEPADQGLYNLLYVELQGGIFNGKSLDAVINEILRSTISAWQSFTGFTPEELEKLKVMDIEED